MKAPKKLAPPHILHTQKNQTLLFFLSKITNLLSSTPSDPPQPPAHSSPLQSTKTTASSQPHKLYCQYRNQRNSRLLLWSLHSGYLLIYVFFYVLIYLFIDLYVFQVFIVYLIDLCIFHALNDFLLILFYRSVACRRRNRLLLLRRNLHLLAEILCLFL